MDRKDVEVKFRCSSKFKARLEEFCEKREWTITRLCKDALELYLEKEKPPQKEAVDIARVWGDESPTSSEKKGGAGSR